MKQKLLVLVGPTAVGKTAMSIDLAKRLNGEIISGDAIQVYRGMDIGSAKITSEEMDGVPHHLIDILDPDEQYSAARFKEMTEPLIEDITARGNTPMIVGGTGLYIQSVVMDYQFQDEDNQLNIDLTERYSAYDNDSLYRLLESSDQAAAKVIHKNNRQRILRALIYFDLHQQSITQQSKNQTTQEKYDTLLVGLTMPRELLYERINNRVDIMIDNGLIDEVKALIARGFEDERSMTAIGYKEIAAYLNGSIDLQTAIDQLKQNSRRFAKRQMTWFRNQMDLNWYDVTAQSTDDIVESIINQYKGESL